MIDIAKAEATVTVAGYSGTYDAAAHGATGTVVGVAGDLSAGGSSLTVGSSFTDAPGGTASWTFIGGANYNDQNGTALISIAKADATVTVTGYSGTYDAAAHGATGTVVGVAGDLSAGGSSLTVGSSFTDAPGGTASWTFIGGANYNDQSGTALISIAKADATVTVAGYSGTYDAAAHGATGTVVGVAGDLSAAGSSVTVGSSFTNAPGGTASWTFIGGTNYNDQSGTALISIAKADATVTVTGYSGTYDAAAHGATGTVVGVAGDLSAGGSSLTVGSSFTDAPGGTASWTFIGGTNYNDQSGTALISIAKADATVTVEGYSGTYDAAAHGATGTVVGVAGDLSAGGSSLTVGSSFTNAPGGTASWTFIGGTNYNDQNGTALIGIAKADATVTVTGYSGTYDAAAHGATGTVVGVAGDLSAGGSSLTVGSSFTNAPGGTASWTFIGGTNYNDQSGTALIGIAKADATVTVAGYSGTYDAAAHGATGTVVGVAGDLSAGGSSVNVGSSFTDAPGGTASWTFIGGANYNDQSGTALISIAKADATVTVTGYSGTYDAAAHGATGTVVGVAGDLSAGGSSLTVGSSFTDAPGGTASWTFIGGTNYNDQSGDVGIVISKADATIVVSPYSATYTANPNIASGSVIGVDAEGAALGGTLSLTGTTHISAGDYPNDAWTFSGGTNYNDAGGTVHDSIAKANAVVAVNGFSGVYDAVAHGASGSVTGVDAGGAALGTSLNLGATFTHVPGGTAHWTLSGGMNYTNQSGDVSTAITKAAPTLVVTGTTTIYDGSPHAASFAITGINGENLTGLVTVNYNGSAVVPVNAGDYAVSATFPGTPDYFALTNTSQHVVIIASVTATSLAASSNPVVPGQSVTFTAVVSPVPPGGGAPTGSVTFKNGATVLGTVPISSVGGQALASLTTSFSTAVSLTITASYANADGNFTASSASLGQTVLRLGCMFPGPRSSWLVRTPQTMPPSVRPARGLTARPD